VNSFTDSWSEYGDSGFDPNALLAKQPLETYRMTRLFLWPLAVALLGGGCGPVVDDDDATADDDDATPDPACIEGYEPLAVMEDYDGDVESIAVHADSETFAVLAEAERVWL
jgi:hypothetical protein